MKLKLNGDQRGVVIAYMTAAFAIVAVAVIWIAMNELVVKIDSWAAASAAGDPGSWPVLKVLWRIAPIVMLFGAVMWAVLHAHRHSAEVG